MPQQGDLSTSPRLAVVADTSEGGLGSAAVGHANDFAARGWMVTLACPSVDGRESPPPGLSHDVHWLSWNVPGTARNLSAMATSALALHRTLHGFRPNIVHAHGLRSFALARLTFRQVHVTNHTFDTIQRPRSPRGLAYRVLPRLAAHAFAVAPGLGDQWTVLIHASPRLRNLSLVTGVTNKGLSVLWLGRLAPPKQPQDFVKAISQAARDADVTGIVAGDGPLLETCRQLAVALGAPVVFVGPITDVQPLFNEVDAFCLLSKAEGIPFAVQEAMWCGLPVVLSDLPSLRYFAGDAAMYATGVTEAADAFVRLTDAQTRQNLGARAGARARNLIMPDSPASDYAQAYSRMTRGRPH